MLPETRALSSGRYAGAAVAIVALAAVLRFYKLGESGRIRWLLASGVASALGLLTHSSSLFVLVGMGMYAAILVLLRPYRTVIVTRQKLIATAAFFVILVGAYAPIALSVSQYLGA